MLQAISIYLIVGVLINLGVDLMYDWIAKSNIDTSLIDPKMSEDRWDNFTKVVVALLWPLCFIYILIQIIKEYTN